jgi:hypothetical protein
MLLVEGTSRTERRREEYNKNTRIYLVCYFPSLYAENMETKNNCTNWPVVAEGFLVLGAVGPQESAVSRIHYRSVTMQKNPPMPDVFHSWVDEGA